LKTLPPRLFVLIFNVSDYHAYLRKNIDYFFKNIIRPNDRLLVLTNNFSLNDYVVEDPEKERKRVKKILEIEAKRIKLELLYLRNKLRSLLEDKGGRSEESILNNRIYVRDYLHYLKAFKNTYFNLQSDQYIKIANHLKTQKVEKWVFNFFQLGMFFYPTLLESFIEGPGRSSDNVEMESLEMMELYLDAYKELQKVDKSLVENIGKLFFDTGASFHTQLLRNRSNVFLDGYLYHPIPLDSENVFLETTKMTGGIVVDSNKIETFIKKVTAAEDIRYILTYDPGKYKGKNHKIKIVVDNPGYRVIYDDRKRTRYLETAAKEVAKEDRQILIKDLSLEAGVLSFTISNITRVLWGNERTGIVLVKIKIMDNQSKILYSKEKKFEFRTEEQELRIGNLPRLAKGLYDVIIEVYDLNNGKNDLAIEDFRVRR